MLNNSTMNDSKLYKKVMGKDDSFSFLYLLLFIIVLGVFICRIYWVNNYGSVNVDGESMTNTLQDGDLLLIKYGYKEAKRGDIIVIDVRDYKNGNKDVEISVPYGKTEFLIKRLIAVEGDRVKCSGGKVFVWEKGTDNYKELSEDYTREGYTKDFSEYEVGKDEIFFLGDNRQGSLDSRYKEQETHIKQLYKKQDIFGVVPKWSLKYKNVNPSKWEFLYFFGTIFGVA